MRCFLVVASGAKKLCALGANSWRSCAAPQLHPLEVRLSAYFGALVTSSLPLRWEALAALLSSALSCEPRSVSKSLTDVSITVLCHRR